MLRDCSEQELRRPLPGNARDDVDRLGKFILVRLGPVTRFLTLHLGMTGQVLVTGPSPARGLSASQRIHTAFSVPAGGRRRQRHPLGVPRRAQVRSGSPHAGNLAPRLEALGPDAWLGDWDAAYLPGAGGPRVPLKAFLLDQRHLAGIGNIYADEILWWAGLIPLRPAGSLSTQRRCCGWPARSRGDWRKGCAGWDAPCPTS